MLIRKDEKNDQKKITCIITVFSILLLTVFSTNAQNLYPIGTKDNTELKLESITTITDKEELKEIIEEQNLSVPAGYYLEKVDVMVYNTEDTITTIPSSSIQPRGLIYEIRNIRVSPKEFYYVNEYDSDWFDGPCTVNEEYTKTCETKTDFSVSVSDSTIKASLGYHTSTKFEYKKSFSTTVAAGKRLNVRIHINYKSTEFDVYNNITGNLAEKDCWIAKPIGLIFLQYTYSK